MNHLCTFFLLIVACCGHLFANEETEQPTGSDTYQTVDIARVKAQHYRKLGFELLPEFVSDTTIGPGQFAAITDVTIRKGAHLIIRPGTVIMFEPQRRMVVEGELFAAEDKGATVVFTHLSLDMRYIRIAIADSLWSGIVVEPGGNLFLNRIVIANATTGIEVTGAVAGNIDISCIDLEKTALAPLIVDGVKVTPQNLLCVNSIDLLPLSTVTTGDSTSGAERYPTWKLPLRIGSFTLAAGGAVAAAYGTWYYRKYGTLYEQSDDPSRYSPAIVDDYRKKALRGQWIGLAGGIGTLLGIAGVTLTFVF